MKGYSLHVGVGEVGGVEGSKYPPEKKLTLCGAQNDAELMAKILKGNIEDIHPIVLLSKNNKATFTIFEEKLDQIICNTLTDRKAGIDSYVCITFSGHGASYKDPEENISKQEFLCFQDRMVLEHEIKAKLLRFGKNVRCFFVIDCCYSGGIKEHSGPHRIFPEIKKKFTPFNTLPQTTQIKVFNHVASFDRMSKRQWTSVLKKMELKQDSLTDYKPINQVRSEWNKIYSIPLSKGNGRIKELKPEEVKDIVNQSKTYYKDLIFSTPVIANSTRYRGEICFLAACSADRVTWDDSPNSTFTHALKLVEKSGNYSNYNRFYERLVKRRSYQKNGGPVIHGAYDEFFMKNKPFTIPSE